MIDRRFLHETLHRDLNQVLDKRIAILGCGAIGANLAISLARRGFRNFALFDNDRIQEYNISTQPWDDFSIGELKVTVLAEKILSINIDAGASLVFIRVDSEKRLRSKLTPEVDLLVDCFDNSESRAIAQSVADTWPVLHAGMSEQNTAEVTWADNYKVPHDVPLEDPCNYPLSRTLIELTVTAAAESISRFLLEDVRKDYFIHATSLSISPKIKMKLSFKEST